MCGEFDLPKSFFTQPHFSYCATVGLGISDNNLKFNSIFLYVLNCPCLACLNLSVLLIYSPLFLASFRPIMLWISIGVFVIRHISALCHKQSARRHSPIDGKFITEIMWWMNHFDFNEKYVDGWRKLRICIYAIREVLLFAHTSNFITKFSVFISAATIFFPLVVVSSSLEMAH